MSELPFIIEAELDNQVIFSKVTGFWDLPATRAYHQHINAAVASMQTKSDCFDMILDISIAHPLPRDAAEYLEQHQPNRPQGIRRSAFVCPNALARIQLRRIIEGFADVAIFTTETDARAWLASA